jgi:hypothetical protein
VYGDTSWRGDCHTETAEAVTFFNAIRKTRFGAVASHIKNEGKRRTTQASWDKAQGLVTGASDIFIPASPAFLCELKRKDHTKSRISKDQVTYLEEAQKLGAFCCVALGWEAAWGAVQEWQKDL